MTNNDIVQKLWNLCDVLRDDGINYSDYVTELVLLLFIKRACSTNTNCRKANAGPIWKANPAPTCSTSTNSCCWIYPKAPTR
jgi:type I restriction-modification system DNA methylase subunit